MRKIFLTISIILFIFLSSFIIVLSTIGIETSRFNKIISNKIIEQNPEISLEFKRIKFKYDIKNFNLFLETKKPNINFKSLEIPIENLKIYLNFISVLKTKPKIDKINIESKEIHIDQLKKIIIKTKPSSLNSLITNRVTKGKILINLELYIGDNLSLKDFIARGYVKEIDFKIDKSLIIRDIKFNFFADPSDILIKNAKGSMKGLLISDANLQITKNDEIILKSDFVTDIKLDNKNIENYLPFLKKLKFVNKKTNFNAYLKNFLSITFDKTLKINNYVYKNNGKVNKSFLKFDKPISNSFINRDIINFYTKNTEISVRYSSDKKNNISATGVYSTNNQSFESYKFKNNFSTDNQNINLEFDLKQSLNIDLINYAKDNTKVAKVILNGDIKKNFIDVKELKYTEDKNLILVEKLEFNKKNIVSLKKIKVKTFDKNILKNDFKINLEKKIKFNGNKFDANNLSKFFNKKSRNNIFQKISKEIEINLKDIETPLSKKLENFRLIGVIQKGKFIKISSKGDFGNNKFLDISMKNDEKNKKKYLEIYSDLPQPLLSEYSFFKGLSGGVLTFSSIIEKNKSTSKLVIDNFKVINTPGVVKLLSLADFGGLADLAEGDGLSFKKMEINMNSNKSILILNELYAVGPSISVLMEGYREETGLTSLKGTLVPAKNLNKFLSKIPIIGKIIIPSEVGEGLFGVSFKMKGMPGKIKTTINPIKTLTPRFITKALEK